MYLKLFAVVSLLFAVFFVFSNDDIDDSLESIVNEAADRTGTQNIDRKEKEFDELSGRKKETKNADKAVSNSSSNADEQTAEEKKSDKKGISVIVYESEFVTTRIENDDRPRNFESEGVYQIKRIRTKERPKSNTVNIKRSVSSRIDEIELFSFNDNVKVHKVYIITSSGRIILIPSFMVNRNSPYIIKTNGERFRKLVIVHQNFDYDSRKSYIHVLGR